MLPKEFLDAINSDLEALERRLERHADEKFANVFVLGLPRSGTTLLAQILFAHLEILCTNHLIAKFWKTPLVGAYLSRITLGSQRSTSYDSDHGKTSYPWEPHEFSWFWHRLLHISDPSQYDIEQAARQIDWDRVRGTLLNLNLVLGAPLVHKPLELVAYHLERFAQLFEKALFVYIERDPLDVACSLAESRLAAHGDLNVWWSSYPPADRYCALIDQPYNVQIAGQVTYLRDMYRTALPLIPEAKLLKTSYGELCEAPGALLDRICARSRLAGCELRLLNAPAGFPVSTRRRDPALREALTEGFATIEKLAR